MPEQTKTTYRAIVRAQWLNDEYEACHASQEATFDTEQAANDWLSNATLTTTLTTTLIRITAESLP